MTIEDLPEQLKILDSNLRKIAKDYNLEYKCTKEIVLLFNSSTDGLSDLDIQYMKARLKDKKKFILDSLKNNKIGTFVCEPKVKYSLKAKKMILILECNRTLFSHYSFEGQIPDCGF